MKHKRPTICTFLFTVLISFSNAQNNTPELWNSKQFAVALTYDDGLNVHLDNVMPILDSLGMKGTFYVPGNSVSLDKRRSEWKAAADAGHELGNHTFNHPCNGKSKGREWVKPEQDLDKYTYSQMLNEIRQANVLLADIDKKSKRTFAYTCGDKIAGDSSIVNFVAGNFIAARGVHSEMNQLGKIDLSEINAYSVHNQSAEELILLLNQAKKENAFIVFLFHGVGGEHGINIELIEHQKLIRYLKEIEKTVWVAPLVEIAEFIDEHQ